MVHLPQDEFLTALTRLFGATRDKGSLYITFKRVPVKGATVAEGEQPPSECLIRARSEKKRISTTVRVRATRVLSATPVRVELARAGRGRGGGEGQRSMALGPPIVRNRGRRAIPILTAGVCAPATRAGESEGLRAVAFKHAEHPDRAHGQFEEEGANKKGEGRRVIFRKVTRGTGLFRCVCVLGVS